ncbi:urease accessory protein UreD [Enterovirga sp. CN4-39]|uniref:urease accessory protein UreD n=1 Tax=Enterovirga sp. CN4-39 TaxID=3400910 RepID=UPI003C009B72
MISHFSERGGRDKLGQDTVQQSTRRQRADARIALGVERLGAATRVVRIAETGSARLRLPKTEGPALEAVTINTGGGIAAGDRFATHIEVGGGAQLVVTTAAAEKIYRSEGDTAEIATTIRVANEGRLDWVPQETILYDAARLRRSLEVALEPGASALLFEATVFGRAAFGETMRSGAYADRWRIRRGDRLVYADTLRITGVIADQLAKRTTAFGRRALATIVYVASDAESRIEEARAALEDGESERGASAWDGLLAVRFLAPDIETLRRDAARFMTLFRGQKLPRVWHL